MTPRLTVALLTNSIPPYRRPLFQLLADTPGWDFHVIQDSPWQLAQDEEEATVGTTHTLASPSRVRHRTGAYGDASLVENEQVHFPWRLPQKLRRLRPDVIISGELGARTLIAAAYGRAARVPVIGWVESTAHTSLGVGRAQSFVRHALKRLPEAFICPGRESAEYLHRLGTRGKTHIVGQAVQVPDIPAADRARVREQERRDRDFHGRVLLFSGRLTREKGVRDLLFAWARLPKGITNALTLVIAGEGPEQDWVRRFVVRESLHDVRILGWVDPAAMPALRAASDVFVLPTHGDCYSLAVAEACAAGLPLIVSPYGGESELVVPGVNGWTCNPREGDALLQGLATAATCTRLAEMGAASAERGRSNAYPLVAARIRTAVESVTGSRSVTA